MSPGLFFSDSKRCRFLSHNNRRLLLFGVDRDLIEIAPFDTIGASQAFEEGLFFFFYKVINLGIIVFSIEYFRGWRKKEKICLPQAKREGDIVDQVEGKGEAKRKKKPSQRAAGLVFQEEKKD